MVDDAVPDRKQTLKSIWSSLQVQLCSVALAGSLFNVVRLPRDAFRYGPIPYLLAYTIASLLVALPVTLLQLAIGHLTHQDVIGVWRAVPILRGVGHLKILTTCICCILYMVPVALACSYLVWIGKGPFPLKDCTVLQMTPNGYQNKMNASECFNTTFLAPFTAYPQYLGIMAILIFFLWFFTPMILYRLHKSLKATFTICAPIPFILAAILCVAVGDSQYLFMMAPKIDQWREALQPHMWHAALVQSLLSVQIKSGYLISSGGSIYQKSDVRWTAITIVLENIIAGWVWVILWVSTGGKGEKDITFVGVLVLIYQSAVNESRAKQWPLLAFTIVFVSGILTMATMLYPIFDRLHRAVGDRWRLIACVGSALGTALTLGILTRVQNAMVLMDELAIPFLVVFTTALEVIAFAFIYGWDSLVRDIEFILRAKISFFWIVGWWIAPFILFGMTAWWLRYILRVSWSQLNGSLWPLLAIFLVTIILIVIFAAIAVAKEEQYNLISKISSAFRPSRLWGPEDPVVRYQWMVQRRYDDRHISTIDGDVSDIYENPVINPKISKTSWMARNDIPQEPYYSNANYGIEYANIFAEKRSTPYSYKMNNNMINDNVKTRVIGNPDISNSKLSSSDVTRVENCKCKRHFSLRVPHYVNGEITTSL